MKIIKLFGLFYFSVALTKYEFVRRKFSPFKMLGENMYFQREQRDYSCEKDNDEEIAEIFSKMNLDIPFSFYDSINFK